MDDPPAIFLAWSVRARAVSKRSSVSGRGRARYPQHPAALEPRHRRLPSPAGTDAHAASASATSPPVSRCSSAWPRSCRCSPTASSRSSRSSAARANPSSRQPQRRHARRRGNPPLRRHECRVAEGALRRPAEHRSRNLAAGSDPEELRPAVPRVPRDHALRPGGRDRRHEPHRANRASPSQKTANDDSRRVDVAHPRGRRPAADRPCSPSGSAPERARRLARRRVQPRRNVADGRPDPDRRARLRDGRRPEAASSSRTAIPTRRRSSRRRAT